MPRSHFKRAESDRILAPVVRDNLLVGGLDAGMLRLEGMISERIPAFRPVADSVVTIRPAAMVCIADRRLLATGNAKADP